MARTRTTATSSRTLSHRLRNDQSGAIIILALAFLTIVLALAVGIIGLAQTGSASLRAYRLERHRRYAADSALQSAVQYVRQNPGLGVSASPPACAMDYAVQEDTASGGAIQVFTPGSVLNVTCEATPGVTDSGARELDLRGEPTGGQGPRDVTFVVRCAYSSIPAKGTLACGSGGQLPGAGPGPGSLRRRLQHRAHQTELRPVRRLVHPTGRPERTGQPLHRFLGARRGAQDRLLVHQGRLIGSRDGGLSRTAHRLPAPHRLP